MPRDNRDPTLMAVELHARRRPGETLAQAADRLAGVDIPDHGTAEAEAAYARLNGHAAAVNAAYAPRRDAA